MKFRHTIRFFRGTCATLSALVLLSGCLSKEDPDEAAAAVASDEIDNEVSGSVGDGPVIGATMRIRRNDGVELSNFESDANASYNIVVRTKGKYYPLSIDALNGTDIVTNTVPDFDLLGSVFEPSKKSVANINPFSTLAVELARDMSGGENKSNLGLAQDIVSTQFNNGLASLASSGPMTTVISGSNIAEIVRASEALGETVRRTRNALNGSGFNKSGNGVVRALASDLTDQVTDGLGGPRSDSRIAAVSTIVAAQVLLETMANELHVNGVDGTNAMHTAIDQVSLQAADPRLDDLTTTTDMILRARIGLAAAYAVTSDPLIDELFSLTSDIQPGMSSLPIRTQVLPGDYRSRLDNAILLVAGGDAEVHETVNAISREGEPLSTGGSNTAPTINGTPSTSVTAGSVYSFTPGASDPEGNALTFDITNLPIWATFDTNSGQLSGTPNDAEVGLYSNITISVSDGEFTSSLATFAITVNAVPVTNTAPTINGTPSTAVLVGGSYSFTPNATDADNDTLTFSVSGLPVWASFDSATGSVSGSPSAGDVGIYENILISVSDGEASAQLPSFSIAVEAIAVGSVTLSWTPPIENTDGSALTDLAGYTIYWGTDPGNYPNSVTINDGSISSYVVDNLLPGSYEFVATSLNSVGVESSYSNPVTKVVQ